MNHRDRVLICSERDIVPCEDGYYRFFTSDGGLNAEDLRIIADELDRRNKPLKEEYEEYLRNVLIERL